MRTAKAIQQQLGYSSMCLSVSTQKPTALVNAAIGLVCAGFLVLKSHRELTHLKTLTRILLISPFIS